MSQTKLPENYALHSSTHHYSLSMSLPLVSGTASLESEYARREARLDTGDTVQIRVTIRR